MFQQGPHLSCVAVASYALLSSLSMDGVVATGACRLHVAVLLCAPLLCMPAHILDLGSLTPLWSAGLGRVLAVGMMCV